MANQIPDQRRVALERQGVECWQIPQARFRAVARDAGYVIESEKDLIGSGDVGEFRAIVVRYKRNAGGAARGEFPAVVAAKIRNASRLGSHYDPKHTLAVSASCGPQLEHPRVDANLARVLEGRHPSGGTGGRGSLCRSCRDLLQ